MTPSSTASGTVEVGVAEDFSKTLSSVPEVGNSGVELNHPNTQPPQTQQPDTAANTVNNAEVIRSLSGSKYSQKGGQKIGQKKIARPKPVSKKEKLVQNKSKYIGSPKYAQKSVQKAK